LVISPQATEVSSLTKVPELCRLVVLISGNGTNLQTIIDACATQKLPAKVAAVISNEPAAYGLQRARDAGIFTDVIDHRDFNRRADFDERLKDLIDTLEPDLVVLAGFMRILGFDLTAHFLGRIINIHPSILPDYPGLNTHARVLADGVTEHGASVHFVTPDLDSGPIILQSRIAVQANDTPSTLAERVHQCEYQIYPRAIDWFATGRLRLKASIAYLDGVPIKAYASLD
jgi:phosphoribosylglycinamide formyltransferase-1